ncbi:TetR family transcriptional regulator [Variovorax sp. J22P168]|uniref:TetR family transcriptional regulator n=1 Tax=Variovorax jilinensis TaxID=3053513 RepID=UPI0025788266|nr:TetR family transcriptional regulator [Variovorax sp. J22P168]MDM0013899.1 TetR family transcriptional regulator [Variovorax sp. J22P168]
MARRTKQEAEETRQSLLDAAEHVFGTLGVSTATLDQIAERAGTTRGAIQWHFKDKVGLLEAMLERVSAPMRERIREQIEANLSEPLMLLVAAFFEPLRILARDERSRNVVAIVTRLEFSPELAQMREQRALSLQSTVGTFGDALRSGARVHGVKLAVPGALAAQGLYALLRGLIDAWVVHPQAYDLRRTGRAALFAYLRGLGFEEATLRGCGLRP